MLLRCFLVLLLSLSAPAQVIIGGGGTGGGGGGGGGTANYRVPITTTSTTWTVTAAEHGFASANLIVQCYTAATPAVPLINVASAPAAGQFSYTVHPTTFTVVITFTAGGNNGGFCAINGSGAPGVPGAAGEVTSTAGTYATDQIALFSGITGDIIKTATTTGFAFLNSGVVSGVGVTGTGSVVLSAAPTLTGTTTAASITGSAAGVMDFSASGSMRVPTFSTGAPPLECDAAAEAGRLRMRSVDSATANGGLRICQQLDATTWGWMPLGYKTGTTLSPTCAVGDIFVDTDATPAGQNIYVCTASNTWTLASGGGGGGSIASTTSTLKGNGAGAAVAVTGTAGDCVRVDGSSGACSTSSGSIVGPFTIAAGASTASYTHNLGLSAPYVVPGMTCATVTGGATVRVVELNFTGSTANAITVNLSGVAATDVVCSASVGATGAAGTGVTDADKGDILVTSSGNVWTLQTLGGVAFGDAATKNTGTAAGTVATGNHAHAALYEPLNANIQTHIADVTTNPHVVTAAQVGTSIPALTTDATPDAAADYVITYDDSAAGPKKVLLSALPAASGVTDGDKGDITVSGSGSIFTIDNSVISAAKVADAGIGSAKLASAVVGVATTPYTMVDSNRARLVSFNSASPIAVTLPQSGAGGEFVNGWFGWVNNRGAGTVTITPTTSNIDGSSAPVVLTTNQGMALWGNGADYYTSRGTGGVGCSKYTVPYTSAQTAALTNAVTLFTLPARAKVTGITIKHSTAFGGGAISAVTVSIGHSGGSATAYTTAQDILQAVSNTAMLDTDRFSSATFAAHSVTANFTSVGANLSALTAGSVDIWVCSVQLP